MVRFTSVRTTIFIGVVFMCLCISTTTADVIFSRCHGGPGLAPGTKFTWKDDTRLPSNQASSLEYTICPMPSNNLREVASLNLVFELKTRRIDLDLPICKTPSQKATCLQQLNSGTGCLTGTTRVIAHVPQKTELAYAATFPKQHKEVIVKEHQGRGVMIACVDSRHHDHVHI